MRKTSEFGFIKFKLFLIILLTDFGFRETQKKLLIANIAANSLNERRLQMLLCICYILPFLWICEYTILIVAW